MHFQFNAEDSFLTSVVMEAAAQCVALVLIEMGLSFSGIVFNLLIVATLRQEASERIAFKCSYIRKTTQFLRTKEDP